MWNGNPNYKKFTYIVILIFVIVGFVQFSKKISIAHAEESEMQFEQELNDNIDSIINDIDSNELDDFLDNEFDIKFLNVNSFLDIVKKVLNGNYFDEYTSLVDAIIEFFKQNFRQFILLIFSLFLEVVLFEIFNNFCESKYADIKKIVKIIFSIIISLTLLISSKQIIGVVTSLVDKIFNFSKILFPILLGLVLLSGSNGTYSAYNALSIFLLNTGSYIFVYVLIPITICIILLTIISLIFSNNKFNKLISMLKSAFKYIIIAFFAIFGIFSSVNIFASSMSDGVNYKLTKFAIKSYVPVLGGYLSDGFDFIHTCSVLIKNSFGICGILVLLFFVLKPILICVIYLFSLKFLSVIVSILGNNDFADYFEKISVSISLLITIIVGIFMCFFIFIYLLILSISVV